MTGSLKMAKLDFFTMKSQLSGYLTLAVIVVLFGFMGSSVTAICITASWFAALMSSNIFAMQEKNNLHRLYGSVSVGLKDIVLGRYVFVFLNYIVCFLAVIVLYSGFSMLQSQALGLPDIMLGFSISLLIFSAITGVQMPLFFKLGYTKAKVWSLVPFIAVIALTVIPSFVEALSGIMQYMLSNRALLIAGSILASCIIELLSYHIAFAAYRKRR